MDMFMPNKAHITFPSHSLKMAIHFPRFIVKQISGRSRSLVSSFTVSC